ncbi:MAG: hypothetical protein U0573_06450 [Phycisphaerales bacterium]
MKFKRLTPIAVDIGDTRVSILQLALRGTERHVHAWASFARLSPDSGFEAEASRISGVLRRRGFVGTDLALCLPDSSTFGAVLELPPARSGAPLRAIAAAEIGRMFKQNPEMLELAMWEVPIPARQSGTTSCMVVACPHECTDPIFDAFARHELDLRTLEPRSASVARACAVIATPAPQDLQAVLSLGWKQTRFLAMTHSQVVLERAIEGADLETLHRVVAGTLGLDTDLAEIAVSDAVSGGRTLLTDPDAAREIRDLLLHFADKLSAEVLTATSYIGRRCGGRKLARVLLESAIPTAESLRDMIAERLPFDVRSTTLAELGLGGSLQREQAQRGELAACFGLCLSQEAGAC